MSIKQHYLNAKQAMTAEKERAIAIERERVTKEQIIPKNAELDQAKNSAINALTEKLNQDIANIQQRFSTEKATILDATEKKKADFANEAISTAISIVSLEYDREITALDKRISELKD